MTTGLFGQELGGKWLDLSAAEKRFAGINYQYFVFRENKRYLKDGRLGGTLIGKIHSRFKRHILGFSCMRELDSGTGLQSLPEFSGTGRLNNVCRHVGRANFVAIVHGSAVPGRLLAFTIPG